MSETVNDTTASLVNNEILNIINSLQKEISQMCISKQSKQNSRNGVNRSNFRFLAKQEVKYMIENDIIRPSQAQWTSLLHLLIKKHGSYRICGYSREHISLTVHNSLISVLFLTDIIFPELKISIIF